MNNSLRKSVRLVLGSIVQVTVLLSIVSCGGGIEGSGNGGGDPKPEKLELELDLTDVDLGNVVPGEIDNGVDNTTGVDTTGPEIVVSEVTEPEVGTPEVVEPEVEIPEVVEPETPTVVSDRRYMLTHVPKESMSKLPESLVTTKTSASDLEPYYQISIQLAEIAKQQLDLNLVALRVDANWAGISDHCDTTPEDTSCDFSGLDISTEYTREIALLEYDFYLEYEFLLYGQGRVTEARKSELLDESLARIGTSLDINNGSLTVIYDETYRYELMTKVDKAEGLTEYVLRWSEDRALVESSVSVISADEQQVLSSIHNSEFDTGGSYGTMLLAKGSADSLQEFNLNYQEVEESTIILESQLTTTTRLGRTEVVTHGQAGDDGGYLSSKIYKGRNASLLSTYHRQESFDNKKELQTSGVCTTTFDLCEYFNSKYFLSKEEVESNINGTWVSVSGVDTQPDAFILLDPEKVDIQKLIDDPNADIEDILLSTGVEQEYAGIVSFILEPRASVFGVTHRGLLLSTSVGYDGALLCRLNLYGRESGSYRTYCSSNEEKIRNAVVIAETYINGRLITEYKANADVSVSQRNY